MMRRLILALSLLALAGASPAAAHGRETTGACLGPGAGGPICHFWTAKVVSINDGDTIGVDIDGDGSRRVYQVRFIGLQAMELHRYDPRRWAGECHSVEAAKRVRRLIGASHWRVRLSAEDPSTRFTYRLGRFIGVKVHGHWQDLGAREMAEGLTLLMSDVRETAWNDRYNRLGQEAARKHIGMWNPTTCGSGPSQHVPMRLWVNWDPPGIDKLDPNGEWIKVQNLSGTTPVPLGHWWLRDSMLRRFTFPTGTVLQPGATITLHVGHGQRSADTFYWGLDNQIFQNIGDGAYLFDPQGDLRQSMVYPCLVACTDPNLGAVQLTSETKRPQFVRLRNVSNHAVDLYGYLLRKEGRPYIFGPSSLLQPGQVMQLDVEGDPAQDTQLERHWGMDHPILRARGDVVRLLTFTNVTVACDAWGDASC
jgi:endonuclease YncB( thermonuclease family)